MELRLPPLAQLFIFALVMWLLDRTAPGPAFALPAQRVLPLVVALLGVAIALAGVLAFRAQDTTVDPRYPQNTRVVVSQGIYRVSRNPMYVGMLLLLVAWGLHLASIWPLLLLPLFVLAMSVLQIRPEERAMRMQFGERYDDYCRRVRRWL